MTARSIDLPRATTSEPARSISILTNHPIPIDIQNIQRRIQQKCNRIVRRFDYRFAKPVERSVEHHGHAGDAMESLQQIEERAAGFVYSLQTRRTINMRNRGNRA